MKNYALVLGLGISGQGAAKLLSFHGYEVIGYDRSAREQSSFDFEVRSDADSLPSVPVSFLVLSPGIPVTHPLCVKARKRGIEVIGEVELALRFLKQPCIGVTGTNGKTTLTLFLAHLLQKAGRKARVLGNVGMSAAAYACRADKEEVLVLELSSFQLETMSTRSLSCGVITTITPDHLDRYGDLASYARAKCRIGTLIQPGGKLFVLSELFQKYRHLLTAAPAVEVVDEVSSIQLTTKRQYWGRLGVDKERFARRIARYFSVDQRWVEPSFKTFSFPPHRLEYVGEKNGVVFYNDSKATNLDATLFAVKAVKKPIILIAGGVHKGGEFATWKQLFKKRVKRVMTLGEAAPLIEEALGDEFPVIHCGDLDEAVQQAVAVATAGDTVLLSPGCASFDQFSTYEERGELFKQLVAVVNVTEWRKK